MLTVNTRDSPSGDDIDLICHASEFRHAREIPIDEVLRAGDGLHGFPSARVVAGVQHHCVTLLDKKPGGHAAEAVG